MAQLLDLYPSAAEPPDGRRRIVALSRGFELLFAGLFLAFALFVAVTAAAFLVPFTGDHLWLGPRGGLISFEGRAPRFYLTVDSLPLGQRLAHIPVGLLNAAPTLIVLFGLNRLFRLYRRGVVFAAENAAWLKLIGAGLVFSAFAPGIGFFFLNSFGLAIDRSWLHASSFQGLILGGIVWVIAEVMQLGRQIEEDREGFV